MLTLSCWPECNSAAWDASSVFLVFFRPTAPYSGLKISKAGIEYEMIYYLKCNWERFVRHDVYDYY